MKKNIFKIISLFLVIFSCSGVTACQSSSQKAPATKTVTRYNRQPLHKAKKIEKANVSTEADIKDLDQKIKDLRQDLKKYTKSTAIESTSKAKLASLNYSGQNIITVNNNDPEFSAADLSKNRGAWQEYGNLDQLNRAQAANALLNKSLMPTDKREPLKIDPTGWHNKRIAGGWLYNRCHLIGYQLTGQNNNWKNLITGTRQLNDPDMLRYEDQVAQYLKSSSQHFVRYRVTPIFRNNELLARGVEMEAQSIGSNDIHFNIYIFNVQQGMILNYADGTSKVA